ncbi:MAG: type I 3-dehydroquinate dehydratase [Chitinispirillaceae bacterium]|nr:type I 3-dehydroquinate dehydratase [Chitinispirillaceae bacterium]
MIKIGQCILGAVPRIAAIVDEFIPVEKLLALKGVADLLEMRVDCYRQPIDRVVEYIGGVRAEAGFPMIGTVRENDYTRTDRSAIFRAIMPFVDCIDIELGSPISDEVLAAASGKTVIVSEHDFIATPDDAALRSMVQRAKRQGSDIVKIATMANSREDVVRLLQFTRSCPEPMVAIGMGPLGALSRVIAPLFGSLFTYGYLTKPVAPGQLSVPELADETRKYFPLETRRETV